MATLTERTREHVFEYDSTDQLPRNHAEWIRPPIPNVPQYGRLPQNFCSHIIVISDEYFALREDDPDALAGLEVVATCEGNSYWPDHVWVRVPKDELLSAWVCPCGIPEPDL